MGLLVFLFLLLLVWGCFDFSGHAAVRFFVSGYAQKSPAPDASSGGWEKQWRGVFRSSAFSSNLILNLSLGRNF